MQFTNVDESRHASEATANILLETRIAKPSPCDVEFGHTVGIGTISSSSVTSDCTVCTSSRLEALLSSCEKGEVDIVRCLLDEYENGNSSSRRILLHQTHPESGNCVAHHIALSGSVKLWQYLEQLPSGEEDAWASWMLARNNHGDTPLMMACVANSRSLVEYMLSSLRGAEENQKQTNIDMLMKLRNKSNDSCLSLACGHGHVQMVELLLQRQIHYVHDDDWKKAQASLNKIDKVVLFTQEHRKDNVAFAQKELLESKREDVETCVNLLRKALQCRSDALAKELWNDCEKSYSEPHHPKKNPQSRSQTKKQMKLRRGNTQCPHKTNGSTTDMTKTTGVTMRDSLNDNGDEIKMINQDKELDKEIVLTELADGAQVDSDQCITCESSTSFDVQVDTELEHTESLPTTVSSCSTSIAEDLLKALCLDVSLLLLTSHEMAKRCSPSQLDALKEILHAQVDAVDEALLIQKKQQSYENP